MHQYKKVAMDYLDSAPNKIKMVNELPLSCRELFEIFEGTDTWTWAGIEEVIWGNEPPFNADTTRAIIQGGTRVEEQFLLWEQDRRMVFRIEQGEIGLLGALLEDYQVEPVGDGACRFTWTIAYEFNGWRQALSPLLGFLMKQSFT